MTAAEKVDPWRHSAKNRRYFDGSVFGGWLLNLLAQTMQIAQKPSVSTGMKPSQK